MKDTIIKGDGTSRKLKAPASMPESFAAWREQLLAGTATVDLALNEEGCEVVGTPISKANLLADAVKSALGLTGADPTVSEALGALSDGERFSFQVGDIKQTARATLGEKWALCNGDAVTKTETPEYYATRLSANGGFYTGWSSLDIKSFLPAFSNDEAIGGITYDESVSELRVVTRESTISSGTYIYRCYRIPSIGAMGTLLGSYTLNFGANSPDTAGVFSYYGTTLVFVSKGDQKAQVAVIFKADGATSQITIGSVQRFMFYFSISNASAKKTILCSGYSGKYGIISAISVSPDGSVTKGFTLTRYGSQSTLDPANSKMAQLGNSTVYVGVFDNTSSDYMHVFKVELADDLETYPTTWPEIAYSWSYNHLTPGPPIPFEGSVYTLGDNFGLQVDGEGTVTCLYSYHQATAQLPIIYDLKRTTEGILANSSKGLLLLPDLTVETLTNSLQYRVICKAGVNLKEGMNPCMVLNSSFSDVIIPNLTDVKYVGFTLPTIEDVSGVHSFIKVKE